MTESPTPTLALADPLHARREITSDDIAALERDGYLRLRDAIDPAVLRAYEPEISTKLLELNTMHLPIEERSTYNKAFLQVTNLARHSARVQEFVLGRRLAAVAADLLQVDAVRLYADQALYKEPSGGITPWHADQYYWPLSSDRIVTVWIPLQDTPLEMGPLEFARGSHKVAFGRDLPISDESEDALQAKLAELDLEVDRSAYALGDVSYHLGWTFHRAAPNRSTHPRKVMTIVYADAEIRATTPLTREHRDSYAVSFPGVESGGLLDTPLNPIIWRR